MQRFAPRERICLHVGLEEGYQDTKKVSFTDSKFQDSRFQDFPNSKIH